MYTFVGTPFSANNNNIVVVSLVTVIYKVSTPALNLSWVGNV